MSDVEKTAVTVDVHVEDGVIVIAAKADLIAVLEAEAAKSTNTIDDALVQMVKMARSNLDWKGYAKGIL